MDEDMGMSPTMEGDGGMDKPFNEEEYQREQAKEKADIKIEEEKDAVIVMKKLIMYCIFLGLIYLGCMKFGGKSVCRYTQLELKYNTIIIQVTVYLFLSYCLLKLLKRESINYDGVCAKIRYFIFCILRTGAVGLYLFDLGNFLYTCIGLTWNLSDSIKWTAADKKNEASFDWFNHIVCTVFWFAISFYTYFIIFFFTVVVIQLSILVIKGECRLFKGFRTLYELITGYFKREIFNENYYSYRRGIYDEKPVESSAAEEPKGDDDEAPAMD